MSEVEGGIDEARAEKGRLFREKMAAIREERAAAGIVTERLDPMERAKRNPTSLKAAITAKCYDCQGRDSDPHPRWRIGNCVSQQECPLWNHRPYQNTFGLPMPASLRASFEAVVEGD